MSFPGLSEQLRYINLEICYRMDYIRAAKEQGCSRMQSVVEIKKELAELEQIRANLEAIQGRVK